MRIPAEDGDPWTNDPSQFDLDVVGVGAFNLDYIAGVPSQTAGPPAQSLRSRIAAVFADADPPFEWGTERLVDEAAMYTALAEVNAVSLDATLGGSAFNAIFALAQMKLGLRLGYVGVAGRVPIPGMSSIQQLAGLGVDHAMVRHDNTRLCGICVSLQVDGERTLLTHAGANAYMAEHLQENFDGIVKYLTSSRAVHVTSFLDPATAERLAAVLRAVRERSPETVISFDPGHVWSSRRTAAIDAIIGLADYLLVNNREFTEIGGTVPGEPQEATAARLLGRYRDDMTIVVKRPSGVLAFWLQDGATRSAFYRQHTLEENDIADATGAGDVFAAGLLATVTSERLQVELGSMLGMELARHKLRYVGTRGHGEFAGIARGFIRSRDARAQAAALPRGVFVAHGGDPAWRAIKEFIEQECRLPVYTFESGVWGSTQVTEALDEYLARCSFAVCVMTAEDMSADGRRWARQNVVHEVGLFQGRYGFDRVLLLVEEGCDYAPHTAERFTVRFPHGGIESAFWRLHKMFQSAGFVAPAPAVPPSTLFSS